MEWFWRLIDHFQKTVAGSALQTFSTIDWIFLCAVLWGLVQGGRKGFSDMFGKLLGIFLVSMLTMSFYEAGAVNFLSLLPIEVARPFSFILLTVFLWLSVSWSVNIFGKIFKVEAQGFLKTLGGMTFGVLRMMLLLSFVAQFLLFLPIESVQKVFKRGHTYTGYTISRFIPELHELILTPFHKPASKKIADPVKAGG
jgi:uncharacterized membrane protein required for colicin V production